MSQQMISNALLTVFSGRVTAKKILQGFGHDKIGAQCDVYIDGKKCFSYADDGCSGEHTADFVDDKARKTFNDFAASLNLAQVVFDNSDGLYKSLDRINEYNLTLWVAEAMIDQKNNIAYQRKLDRACKEGFVIVRQGGFAVSGWRGIKNMADLLTHPRGLAQLQASYDRTKANLKAGERIANPAEQLVALGIKV